MREVPAPRQPALGGRSMLYSLSQIDGVAPAAKKALGPSFERLNVASVDEFIDMCAKDLAQLWRDGETWIGTIVRIDASKRAYLSVAASDGPFNPELLQEIERFALVNGCTRVMLSSCLGWEDSLRTYSVADVIFEKELHRASH